MSVSMYCIYVCVCVCVCACVSIMFCHTFIILLFYSWIHTSWG
jgi:hypothetical protein